MESDAAALPDTRGMPGWKWSFWADMPKTQAASPWEAGRTAYDRTSLTGEAESVSRTGGAEVVLTNKSSTSCRGLACLGREGCDSALGRQGGFRRGGAYFAREMTKIARQGMALPGENRKSFV